MIGALRKGASQSCGCVGWRKNRTHGLSSSPEHVIWRAINQRCHNPKSTAYPDYGGRGIQVCPEWRESFAAFYEHVGPRPDGMQIDRIDNDGHYEPGNVRWATRKQQNANTRWTHEARVRHGRINALKRWHPDSEELKQLLNS